MGRLRCVFTHKVLSLQQKVTPVVSTITLLYAGASPRICGRTAVPQTIVEAAYFRGTYPPPPK